MKFLTSIALILFSLTGFAQTELPKVLTLEIDTAESLEKLYQMPRYAWFKLPTYLSANTSSSADSIVTIYYNLLPNNQYEFQCSYKTGVYSS